MKSEERLNFFYHYGILYLGIAVDVCGLHLRKSDASGFLFLYYNIVLASRFRLTLEMVLFYNMFDYVGEGKNTIAPDRLEDHVIKDCLGGAGKSYN